MTHSFALCGRWTRQSGARRASLCVTENYHCPLSESPSLLASEEHSNKESMKSQSAKTEREKKRGFFLVISEHSSWIQSNEICSLSVAISHHRDEPATLTLACFSQTVAVKVTWRLGSSRKALFFAIPPPLNRQASMETPRMKNPGTVIHVNWPTEPKTGLNNRPFHCENTNKQQKPP